MAKLFVQRPADHDIELLQGHVDPFRDVSHDAMDLSFICCFESRSTAHVPSTYRLGLVVALFASRNVLVGDTALGQINVALVLVYSEDNDDLFTAHADELLDGADASSRQLAQQDHALLVVELEQRLFFILFLGSQRGCAFS